MKIETTVMLLDDHPVLLRGLEALLNATPGVRVAGSHATVRDFVAAVAAAPEAVDVAIVDYALGPDDVDCRNLLMAMRRRFPDIPVLVLSAQYSAVTVTAALQAGARGYLSKSAGPAEIMRALADLQHGRLAVEADMVHALTGGTEAMPSPEQSGGSPLSPREREVLLAVLDGMTTGEIAAHYGRAASTISAQKKSGCRKLGVRTNSELFQMRHLLRLD